MYPKKSSVRVTQSNGLSLRDRPHPTGTIIKKIPCESNLIVRDTYDAEHVWIQVDYAGLTGWAVADDKLGTVNIKLLDTPKKKRSYRRKTSKGTASP